MSDKITEIFNKFAGREVGVAANGYTIAENDPTITEIKKEAEANGLTLRVWTPGAMGTMDYSEDRLNVHLARGEDNKYRVKNYFDIG